VKRLEDLKASKLKELILRKQKELQEISKKSHIIPDNYADIEKAVSSIEYGEHANPSYTRGNYSWNYLQFT
jgi:protein regulator of cytokinesis 1